MIALLDFAFQDFVHFAGVAILLSLVCRTVVCALAIIAATFKYPSG